MNGLLRAWALKRPLPLVFRPTVVRLWGQPGRKRLEARLPVFPMRGGRTASEEPLSSRVLGALKDEMEIRDSRGKRSNAWDADGARRDVATLAEDGNSLTIEPIRAPTSMFTRSSVRRFSRQKALPSWGAKTRWPGAVGDRKRSEGRPKRARNSVRSSTQSSALTGSTCASRR